MASTVDVRHPAIDGVLSAAATLLGMEVVFVGAIDDDSYTFERVRGELGDIADGARLDRTDSFCHRLLAGAPPATADAAGDSHYTDVPARARYGVCSYVGVPVRDARGVVVATLCGVDRGRVEVGSTALEVLRELAEIVAAHLALAPVETGVVIRRTPQGWLVGDGAAPADDLTTAMALADLLAGDLRPGVRPPRPVGVLDETDRLRLSVSQLEHALTARVVVEQAIGVLAERQHTGAREAFERLRRVARSRGRRVHDLAGEVVASAAVPGLPLPPELAGPR